MPKDPVPLDALLGQGSARPPRGRQNWLPVMLAFVMIVLLVAVVGGSHLGQAADRTPVAVLSSTPPAASAAVVVATTSAPSPTPTQRQEPTKATLAIDKQLIAAGPEPSLPWPTSGQAKVEIAGLGVLGSSGADQAVPIASITKVMTAYTILRGHPLAAGESGPTITVTEAEAAEYLEQKARGESVVVVAAGEELTLREALTGLLVASGSNLAGILARWDAGSQAAFVDKMNSNAQRLGMSSTRYVDASGFDAGSVSTASDLLKLAPAAMAQPTLAELVGTSTASIPLNENVKNPNSLLGLHGVIGIKTGTTTAAGGCLLFAAHREVDGRTMTIYGAVLGITGERSRIHSNARDAGDALVVGAGDQLHRIALIRAGTTVATLVDREGAPVNLTVAKGVTVTGWSGQKFRFALPTSLAPGRVPTKLTVHTPTKTFTVPLVKQ